MNDYITIKGVAEASLEEKKSVFIANISPVTNDDEAVAFINSIRRKYPDAKHNVYAYMLRTGSVTRYSDDREPQGSAGLPVLETIRKNSITDTVIVVTRYFGGILLGTGGLARAYSAAAKKAIDLAGVCRRELYSEYEINCTYADYQKLVSLFVLCGVTVCDTVFSECVRLVISFPKEKEDAVISSVTEQTYGRCIPNKTGEKYGYSEL